MWQSRTRKGRHRSQTCVINKVQSKESYFNSRITGLETGIKLIWTSPVWLIYAVKKMICENQILVQQNFSKDSVLSDRQKNHP